MFHRRIVDLACVHNCEVCSLSTAQPKVAIVVGQCDTGDRLLQCVSVRRILCKIDWISVSVSRYFQRYLIVAYRQMSITLTTYVACFFVLYNNFVFCASFCSQRFHFTNFEIGNQQTKVGNSVHAQLLAFSGHKSSIVGIIGRKFECILHCVY